jgi:hypothetical protein
MGDQNGSRTAAKQTEVTMHIDVDAISAIKVDPRDGEVIVTLPDRTVIAGCVELDNYFDVTEVADQISDLIGTPVDVAVTCAMLNTSDGTVYKVVNNRFDQLIGVVDVVDDHYDMRSMATKLLCDHGFINYPTWQMDWEYTGGSSVDDDYWCSYSILLSVDAKSVGI